MTGSRRKISIATIAALAVAAILILYALVDPASHFFPRCPFHTLTGLQCPGCGSQRAIHALLNGHISDAWHYNAFMLLALPAALTFIAIEAFPDRFPRLRRAILSPAALCTILTATILWTIARNIL